MADSVRVAEALNWHLQNSPGVCISNEQGEAEACRPDSDKRHGVPEGNCSEGSCKELHSQNCSQGCSQGVCCSVATQRSGGAVKLYVLADSTYASCCIDEVAAAHVKAECVVHYGPACFTRTSRLPVRFILGQAPIDVADCGKQLSDFVANIASPVLVLHELVYAYAISEVKHILRSTLLKAGKEDRARLLTVATLALESKEMEPVQGLMDDWQGAAEEGLGGLRWSLPRGQGIEDTTILWIGNECTALTNLLLCHSGCKWYRYEPDLRQLHAEVDRHSALLRRRYYLMERAKDASIVGIVSGTPSAAGGKVAMEKLQKMVIEAGKRPYLFSMGRPTPAKLANFPECEVFVLVACNHSALLDSREFLSPIITPFEAVLAFTRNKGWTGEYRVGLGPALEPVECEANVAQIDSEGSGDECESSPRFSLIKGGYVSTSHQPRKGKSDVDSGSLVVVDSKSVIRSNISSEVVLSDVEVKSGTVYFQHRRGFQGLELPPHMLVDKDMSEEGGGMVPGLEIVKGKSGRAANYDHEGNS